MLQALKQIMVVTTEHQLHFDTKLPDNFPVGQVEVGLVLASQETRNHTVIDLEKLTDPLKDPLILAVTQ